MTNAPPPIAIDDALIRQSPWNRWLARAVLSRAGQRRLLRATLLAVDALMLATAFALAYTLRFDLRITLVPDVPPTPLFYAQLMAFLLPLWIALFALFNLYNFEYLLGGTAEYAQVFNACTVGMMGVVLLSFVQPTFHVARGWLVGAWLLSTLFVGAARFGMRRVVYFLRHRGLFISPALLVGTNEEALELAQQLRDHATSGLALVGLVGTQPHAPSRLPVPLLGGLDELETLIARHEVEELIVASTALSREELLALFEQVNRLPHVELRLSSGLYEVLATGVRVKTTGNIPLMSLNKLRLDPIEAAMKTALDYALTLPAVLMLAPLLALLALLIKLDSPGPVIHRRRVLGRGGKPFYAFKFRTMHVNGDAILAWHPRLLAELRANHKLKDDPRITRVGRWLRRSSLDELPQLFNVLLGQMSLVGPRMITAGEVEKYGRLKANLLTVKPGVTGLWQVSGRSDISYEERVRLDMHYIRTYTIWRDLQILFVQTLPAVIRGKGAY